MTTNSEENMSPLKLLRNSPLQFEILAKCTKSRCRTSRLTLPHHTLETPTFMPVGTQGTVKGLLPEQVSAAGADIILGNTYHLGTRPGKEVMTSAGGLHQWMSWDRGMLTDSGGFQMVSLLKLAKITEDGVTFESPYDGSKCLLTPEESIQIQNSIGADIMMQLDDVVDVRESSYERFKEATYRTTRWLDRCISADKNRSTQNLFPIVQGGLFRDLRELSCKQLIEREAPGYAIGGLSGGEDKNKFWPVVEQCTALLPQNKPRYCMGVGFAPDLVVCTALGVDMFDCVYPTRTARFGCALVQTGQISLKSEKYREDFSPIDSECDCSTCKNYTRAYINAALSGKTAVACHLLSVHNIAYQMRLMKSIRESVKEGKFPEFVQTFMTNYYGSDKIPEWIRNALASVNISLQDTSDKLRSSSSCFIEDSEEEDLSALSGFNKVYDSGFTFGNQEDFPEAEERGRMAGFCEAFSSIPTEKKNEHQSFENLTLNESRLKLEVKNAEECSIGNSSTVSSIGDLIAKLSYLKSSISILKFSREKIMGEQDLKKLFDIITEIDKNLNHIGSEEFLYSKSGSLCGSNGKVSDEASESSNLSQCGKCDCNIEKGDIFKIYDKLFQECSELALQYNWKL